MWKREDLQTLDAKPKGSHIQNDTIFVPLSLVVNPDLPNALLGKQGNSVPTPQGGAPRQSGDGLYTEMAMPEGDEVINMGDLPKNEFFGLVANAGLAK